MCASCSVADNEPLTRSVTSKAMFTSGHIMVDDEVKIKPNHPVSEYAQKILRNKDVSVGAGARIQQELKIDTLPLKEWFQEPQSLIRLYFVFGEQLETIVRNGGIKKLENKEAGFMTDKVEVG